MKKRINIITVVVLSGMLCLSITACRRNRDASTGRGDSHNSEYATDSPDISDDATEDNNSEEYGESDTKVGIFSADGEDRNEMSDVSKRDTTGDINDKRAEDNVNQNNLPKEDNQPELEKGDNQGDKGWTGFY